MLQVGQLECDKARLMDRLEEATGEPLGDLSQAVALVPASAVPVAVPGGDGSRQGDAHLDEKRALGSVLRIANTNSGSQTAHARAARSRPRRGAGGAAAAAGSAVACEAVAAVRRLRAERDALRRRLFELLPQLSDAERYANARQVLRHVQAAIGTMEQFVGGMNPEVVAGVSWENAESSAQAVRG